MFHFGAADPAGRRHMSGTATDREFIEREIACFKAGKRREMLDGERYFDGQHDILRRRRTVIGENGEAVEAGNLPDNHVVDNQYRKMVVQKTEYLLGRPFDFDTEDTAYAGQLAAFFDAGMRRLMKEAVRRSLNQGIAWLFPGYDSAGEFRVRCFNGYEIIPGWRDAEHSRLDYAIRVYGQLSYEGEQRRVVERVELFDTEGVHFFRLEKGRLTPEEPCFRPYLTVAGKGAHWERIPLVAVKRDSRETPMIRCLKSLQDGLNAIISNFQNNMEEDCRNTIMILVNYDGENLAEFRRKLAAYGAVKVRTVDGAPGDVKTLRVEVNAENYRTIIDLFRRAIIENAMGYDAKDERLTGSPNQMNLRSMYCDVDLDANELEGELQAAFEALMWFVNAYFQHSGRGDFDGERVRMILNRDMIVNEGETIENAVKSMGLLSRETLVSMHPWVDDWKREMARLKAEEERKGEA